MLNQIPELPYALFFKKVLALLQEDQDNYIVNYYGFKEADQLRFICAVANLHGDYKQVCSYTLPDKSGNLLAAISHHHAEALCFEQEIAENLGVQFVNLPKRLSRADLQPSLFLTKKQQLVPVWYTKIHQN